MGDRACTVTPRQAEACPTETCSVTRIILSCVLIGDQSPVVGTFYRGGSARGPGRARCWSCGDGGGAVRRGALRARTIPGAAPEARFPLRILIRRWSQPGERYLP